jgi:predicted DNA-binding transcriptional regulator YafY
VSPRAFGSDGLRWHVRAFCHQRNDFRDFNVGRIKEVRKPDACGFTSEVDEDWISAQTMTLQPNPALDKNKRTALEMDYGMKQGKLKVTVRKAMLTYTARRLGFVSEEATPKLPLLNESKQMQWIRLD